MADMTAPAFQKFYDKMDGISIPQPFCQSFVPFAIVINKLLDKIPGFDKLNIDSEGMKKKFGLMGEPAVFGYRNWLRYRSFGLCQLERSFGQYSGYPWTGY